MENWLGGTERKNSKSFPQMLQTVEETSEEKGRIKKGKKKKRGSERRRGRAK